MTWARFSDTWADQPRVEALSDAAVAVFVAGVCYSARHLTDGQIPAKKARTLRAVAEPEAVVAELIAAGFWIERGESIEIVDWETEHLLPADEVRRQQERKRKNMADWRARNNGVTGNATGNEPGKYPGPRPAPPRNNVKGVGGGRDRSVASAPSGSPPTSKLPPEFCRINFAPGSGPDDDDWDDE